MQTFEAQSTHRSGIPALRVGDDIVYSTWRHVVRRNLQNIPTLMGPLIRKAFIPDEGELFWEADASQMELRIAAWYSRDIKMIEAYRAGVDFHRIVASEVFQVPYGEVTDDQRYIAKYIDFGILYGRSAKSLADAELRGKSVAECQLYIDNFLGQFPQLREWTKQQYKFVELNGYVRSGVGRRRRWPLITDETLSEIQRESVNTPIQSLASDITFKVLSRLELESFLDRWAKIFLTVHDSIDGSVRKDSVQRLREEITRVSGEVVHSILGDVLPFKFDLKVGPNWGELEKIQ